MTMTLIDEAFAAMREDRAFLAAPPHIVDRSRWETNIPVGHLGVFSSGSVALPRCILRTWASWRDSFAAIDSRLGVQRHESVGLLGPDHSTMMLFAGVHALHSGAIAHVTSVHAATMDYDIVHAVPSVARDFVDDVLAGRRRAPRLLVTAGAHAPTSLWDRAAEAGIAMVEYYGSAETSFIAWRDHDGAFEPIPGVDIDIRDGLIWVRSPYVAVGYLDDIAGPLHTDGEWVSVGDAGTFVDTSDGGLIVRGRVDTAVSTAGHTILVEDIELMLRDVAGVDDVAVVGIPHSDLGEIIAAFVIGPATDAALREAVRQLPAPARPRLWLHDTHLPRLPSGKIDRGSLRERAVATRGAR